MNLVYGRYGLYDRDAWERRRLGIKQEEVVREVPKATEETMAKLNKALEKVDEKNRGFLERYYHVPQRGYWGEWSANNCISKLGGK